MSCVPPLQLLFLTSFIHFIYMFTVYSISIDSIFYDRSWFTTISLITYNIYSHIQLTSSCVTIKYAKHRSKPLSCWTCGWIKRTWVAVTSKLYFLGLQIGMSNFYRCHSWLENIIWKIVLFLTLKLQDFFLFL